MKEWDNLNKRCTEKIVHPSRMQNTLNITSKHSNNHKSIFAFMNKL